tara:strand:- start:3941 stop:4660 length:720 start_codon:yes stop_codon:yes gene_type:complete
MFRLGLNVFIVEKRNLLNHNIRKKLIYEPVTFLTNIPLIILATIYGYSILGIYYKTLHLFHFNFAGSFFSLALASFLGAIFHGFGPHFRTVIRERVWKFVLICLGLAFFFNLNAAFSVMLSKEIYTIYFFFCVLGLGAFLFQTFKFNGFGHSIKFFTISHLLIIIIFLLLTIQSFDRGYFYILLSCLLTTIAGSLWMTGWSLSKKFNNNDLFHLIQILSIWLIYRGIILINDSHFISII